MGLVCNKIMLEDYLEKETIYSKLIRGNLEFYIEPHHLDGGKHLQLLFYLYPFFPSLLKKIKVFSRILYMITLPVA